MTNKKIGDWPEVDAGDQVLATVVLASMLDNSQVLNIKGRNSRFKELNQAAGGLL